MQNASLGGLGGVGQVEPLPAQRRQVCPRKGELQAQRNCLHISDRTFCICVAAKCKWLSLNWGRCCRERLWGLGLSRGHSNRTVSCFPEQSDAAGADSAGSTNLRSPGSASSPQTKRSSDLLICALQWPVQLLQTGSPRKCHRLLFFS